MDSVPGIVPGIPVTPVPEQNIPVWEIEQTVQTVKTPQGEMALWAIVSEFNVIESAKMVKLCVNAFNRLGREDVSEKLLEALKLL